MVLNYAAAGVDIAAADRWLRRMGPRIRRTHGPEVLRDVGAFAGLFRLGAGRWRDPVLVASTDGVGTKLEVARLAGEHRGIGVDVVAMNVNDVLVYGARPLFFLDYLAVGRLEPHVMSDVVAGVADGCRQSGCALLGGETAEMPGVYAGGRYDVAGFCVGIAECSHLISGRGVRAGDAIVGLASSGVHANGFSLIRKVFSRRELLAHRRALLAPTRIYVRPVLAALARVPVAAIVHVTGGGVSRRILSLVARRPGLRAVLWPGRWRTPPIFAAIQQAGRVPMAEMFATFNMGIGMAMACRAADVPRLVGLLRRRGVAARRIGTIETK